MEQTFMTIHNLAADANILFASDSIVDILGFQPDEVLGRSCFDYFHPDEVPFARKIHTRGVLLDKAAVLHYLRIRNRQGEWVSCECCFTVVHDVLVACTSIYKGGEKSQRRAIEAPQVRRIFSSSPRDPRYHMLEHLSPKFKMPPMEREPRAALILNRFTRTLTVMFATNAVSTILGVSPDQIRNKSFYECIVENCLSDAVKCLESAKANDSIAYLRFWYRDPRREEDFEAEEEGEARGDEQENLSSSNSDSDGGAHLHSPMDIDMDDEPEPRIKTEPMSPDMSKTELLQSLSGESSSSSNAGPSVSQTRSHSHHTSPASSPSPERQAEERRRRRQPIPTFELEAVVSCTSDGLVVILRKARPQIPAPHPPLLSAYFQNGLFAAPWGAQPISPYYPPEMLYHFSPPLLPQYMPLQEHVKAAGGPPVDQLMRSIRDVAVFAWALVGINGNLATYARGIPRGEAEPPDGLPIWDSNAGKTSYSPPENQAARRWANYDAEQSQLPPPPVTGFSSQGYSPMSAGYSNMNYSYTPQTRWVQPEPYTPAYVPPPPRYPQYQQAQQDQGNHTMSAQGQWSDGPATFSWHGVNSQSIPSTQATDPGGTPPPYHYAWP